MKKDKYILFTAGQGPIECAMAVQGIQHRFKQHLDDNKISYEVVQQKKGDMNRSIETILFKVSTIDVSIINPWIGTILWICQSPIRKFHRRKNWYIRCEEVQINEQLDLNLTDVTVQTFRASGPGGQHRNKVETAVRLIHKTTGIIVTATNSKSQAQNKKKAWGKLEEQLKVRNKQQLNDYNTDQWLVQQEIERGRPVKTFKGKKFIQ